MAPRQRRHKRPPREVYTLRPGGIEERDLDGFTSDEDCIRFAQARVETEVTAHLGRHAGTYSGEREPADTVVARGLRARPGFRAWFPAVEATLRLLGHRPPRDEDMPEVHDYRTARAKALREQAPDLWSRPVVQALGKRLGWPGF